MPLPAFATAGSILNDAAGELGLISADMADPYASAASDPNIYQLTKFLKSLGQDIVREKNWTQNHQQFVFATVAGQETYALPTDYLEMLNQTAWNRSNRLPIGGPLSPQLWQYLQARQVGVVFTVLFRPWQRALHLYPGQGRTPGDYQIAYEYMSAWWVQTAAQQARTTSMWLPSTSFGNAVYVTNGGNVYQSTGAGTSGTSGPTGTGAGISDGGMTWNYVSAAGTDAPTALDDLILFDKRLVLEGLKLKWRKEKGFPYDSGDYEAILENAMDTDSAAPVLKLGSRGWEDPLIGDRNVPLTGFGQ